ncbi:acyltransferase family protein [Noviherbaspirillum saxi]|uniref:Acyltransferase n=1 Tax=Noviherbaspirillum saxi TaxID=2320863 RepID=A0A3A3FU95_9BURK|nr:acyltransferase [Noviherbaspirillum saxi]RJF99363.1 acyltransferase [Noviherbaspirillum saxi]
MLGTFRLLLALLVALSHAGVAISGLNPGVVAVVCFYLISGYVMTGLLRSHYASLPRVPAFYLDRALRLFPQYLVIAALTLSWFALSGGRTDFLQHAPNWHDLFNNLVVVPLNYFMFNGSDQFTLVPPAWSLGAEIQFYLLIPFLLLWRLRLLTFAVGLVVFGMAAWGMLNTDTFGYRLLPGVLVFFLIGSALYEVRGGGRAVSIVIGGIAIAALAWFILGTYERLPLLYNRETLLGMAIGLPALYLLGRLPQHWLDDRLGDLSYGVFLNHFLVQWTGIGQPSGMVGMSLYLLASLLIAALTQGLVERPVLRLRRRLRVKRASPQPASYSA